MGPDEYNDKETNALASFFGEIEHLKTLETDLCNFLSKNGEDSTKYDTDQKIEFELRISLLFSFFHICIEHFERSKFKDAIKKNHSRTESFLKGLNEEDVALLKKYRNKTFHENVDLEADVRVKKQLDVKTKFEHYHELVKELLSLS
ncbi:MAG: hypothetical protein HN353_02670 [Bdellovibrionales bacterium]|nr:hypothetical protein [Bdellovibrionales bacterium]MBT3525590.1 hypothetical protein [Bdellovibrionales bacterium]MBT7765681.1 hypothetical protein [Bdellovibrionales bacterium]